MTQQNTESQPSDVTIIRKSDALQKRVIRPGNDTNAAQDAIARAEQALEELSVNFDEWMQNETDVLVRTRDDAIQSGFDKDQLEAFYQAAHNLKGQACTLGYPFADEICASLCRLLDKTGDKSRIPARLVMQHVDAVRALVHEKAKGTDNPKASILAKRLRDVTNDFITGEMRRDAAA